MTDTTQPPNRPAFRTPTRPADRGGDKPRARGTGDRPRDDSRRDPAAKTRGAEPAPPRDDARIAKVMARAGLCSRRDAEGWIAAGRVAVNGTVIDSPALNVKPGDRITVDGQPLPEREQTRLYMFHKPRGLVTTARDPEGRPTIFENLPEGLPRLVSVGRLDINTEGLMLLTNDGGLARVLELPATGWLRRYRVRANGAIDQAKLDALKAGITIDGVDYAGIEAVLDRVQGANAWLTMGLREGKNREIKRVLETLGLAVTRLIRISFGPFQLGELAEGAVEAVPTRVLREQLGPGLAAQAGVDLDEREEPVPPRRGARVPEGVAPPRPSRSEKPAPRPHVSALRTARTEEATEGRRRIERGATADRKGRAVTIERVIPVAKGTERGSESRNGRRFASEKQGYVAGQQKTRAEAGGNRRSPVRDAEGLARPRRDDDARPARSRAGGFDDKPRGERPAARARTGGFDDKPRGERPVTRARTGGFDDKPRGERPVTRARTGGFDDKPRGERPAARARTGGFDDKPRGERPPARARTGGFDDKPRGERPVTRARTGGFDDKPWGERPAPRARTGVAEERPRDYMPSKGKPAGGKPQGRPGGFGSERPATGRNKTVARPARPSGGKPTGGKPFRGKPPGARP